MTEDDLKAIEARRDAAALVGSSRLVAEFEGKCYEDIPALIAEVRRLQTLLDKAMVQIERLESVP